MILICFSLGMLSCLIFFLILDHFHPNKVSDVLFGNLIGMILCFIALIMLAFGITSLQVERRHDYDRAHKCMYLAEGEQIEWNGDELYLLHDTKVCAVR